MLRDSGAMLPLRLDSSDVGTAVVRLRNRAEIINALPRNLLLGGDSLIRADIQFQTSG